MPRLNGGSTPPKDGPKTAGPRGPIPKRADQRRRKNEPEVPVQQPAAVPDELTLNCQPPAANPMWHPTAAQWYAALPMSGQAIYYVHSDWQQGYLCADAISRDLSADGGTGRLSSATINLVLRTSTALLLTEGDRRRARIELAKAKASTSVPEPEPGASVADMAAWRDHLGA
jgi:hypothetical protein